MPGSAQPKTYILVHGAWHAQWCWKKLTPILQARGHTVIAPDLPGHGQHKMSFHDVTMHTYINAINHLVATQHHPVILVGHSMGGAVISQLSESLWHRIEKLIYISAFLPDNQSSLFADQTKMPASLLGTETQVNVKSREISLIASPKLRQLFYHCCTTQDATWALTQLQSQPLYPFRASFTVSFEKFKHIDKLYIECLQDQAIPLIEQRRMHKMLSCQISHLDTDHSPFLSTPLALANILCSD